AVPAEVAEEKPARHAVVGERDVALDALRDVPAPRAVEEGREAAPVHEQDRALPAREGFLQEELERPGEQRLEWSTPRGARLVAAELGPLSPHVHDLAARE